MKKVIILILFFNLYALDLSKYDIIYLFKNRYFNYICHQRWKYINKYLGKREDLLSLVGYSCLKKHQITLALDVAKALRFTKTGRSNANYIATLFNIKTLIIRYIKDTVSLKDINIPYVLDDDLGKVFYLLKKQQPSVKNGFLEIEDNKAKIKLFYDVKRNNIVLNIYKDKKLLKKEIYW